MRTFARACSLLFGLLLVAAPSALAHGGYDAGAPLGEGSLQLRLVGAPLVVAQAPLRLEAASDVRLPLEARLVDPVEGAGAWFPLRDEGALRVAHVSFAAPGAWRVDVRAGAAVASFDVPVWPAGPTFVEPAGDAAARGVVVAGHAEPLAFQLVDAAHRPVAPPADAVALVAGPEGAQRVPLAARDGLLVLDAAWDTPGERTVEVLSGEARLEPGDRPPAGVLVVAPGDADVYGLDAPRETPLGPLALGAMLVALALARRLTRAPP